jgi:hypothetical protein
MYRAIGYYITCDDALCVDCFTEHTDGSYDDAVKRWEEAGGFEGWTEPIAIFEDTEADSPTHCVQCSACIEHGLTDDGYAYVLQAIYDDFTRGKQNPVTVQWIDAYGEYCGDDFEVPGGNEIHVADLIELHRVLPRDLAWMGRDDLRQHALLAGWGA